VPAIRLELLSESHIPAVEEMLTDDGVLRYTRVPEPVPSNLARTWLAFCEEARRESAREAFAIVGAEDMHFSASPSRRGSTVRSRRSVYFKQGRRHDFEIWSRLSTDP
jgi:hypothetical protein